jgi:hypothetical protein
MIWKMQSFVAHLPVGVKLGNTKREQMTSAVHPTTDIAKILRHFRFVPILLQKCVEGCREQ